MSTNRCVHPTLHMHSTHTSLTDHTAQAHTQSIHTPSTSNPPAAEAPQQLNSSHAPDTQHLLTGRREAGGQERMG